MRLVLISDTHSQHDKLYNLPEGDVLVHAGDLTMLGKRAEYESAATWLNDLPHKHKIVILGNHDFTFPAFQRELNSSVHFLHDSGITIDGKNFWGSPFTPRFGYWAHMENRGEDIRKHWTLIPDETDVLITHGPPAGILDKTLEGDEAGCGDLFDIVTHRINPEIHVFGHIHEAYGIQDGRSVNQPCFVNASIVNRLYEVQNLPIVMDI